MIEYMWSKTCDCESYGHHLTVDCAVCFNQIHDITAIKYYKCIRFCSPKNSESTKNFIIGREKTQQADGTTQNIKRALFLPLKFATSVGVIVNIICDPHHKDMSPA